MPQNPTVFILLTLIVFAIGFITGLIIGFSAFGSMAKSEFKNRSIKETPEQKPESVFIETKDEERVKLPFPPIVSIKTPVLDSAGVPLIGEELIFGSDLLDISPKSASIFSKHFLPKGLMVEIACADKKLTFAFRRAEVRSVTLTETGLKIGLQFFEKLDL